MKAIWIWLFCIASAGIILVTKLDLTYDLASFLPPPSDDAQRLLVEQLGQSPGSNLMLVGIMDASDDLLLEAKYRLEALPSLTAVRTDLDEISIDNIPEPLLRNRFLLEQIDYSANAMTETLERRALDLRYAGGSELLNLIASDPYLTSLNVLESISITSQDSDSWISEGGYRILLAETSSPAFDIGAQKQIVEATKSVLEELVNGTEYRLSGVGVIGVDLQETIQSEATLRSILASIGMAIVLLLAYRKLSTLALAALPLLTGGITGLAVLSLVYPQVHGITLAFGFTLLGIAIDYPLHLYSHARDKPIRDAVSEVRHPLLTGLASTVIAYLAIMFSGADGLAQLGLFTAVGLISAALVCLFVLPQMSPTSTNLKPDNSSQAIYLHWKVSALLAAIVVGQFLLLSASDRSNRDIWNENLSALSPIPEDALIQDNHFRTALGTADLRYLITIRDKDLEQALEKTEALDTSLSGAKDQGLVKSWRHVTSLIPSQKTQTARKSQLPSTENLEESVSFATEATGFKPMAFTSFQNQLEQSRDLDPINTRSYADSSLQSFIDSSLYQANEEWVSVVSLFEPGDINDLSEWLAVSGIDANLVDLKSASEDLVSDYRSRVLTVLGGALILVFGLLLWRVRLHRAMWCLSNVVLGMVCTGLILLNLGTALNLYHLIALLLVAGLGLDYSLFLSREKTTRTGRRNTTHATLACTVSTVTVFTILGSSSIPALHSLGMTVALGSVICFLAARLGCRTMQPN